MDSALNSKITLVALSTVATVCALGVAFGRTLAPGIAAGCVFSAVNWLFVSWAIRFATSRGAFHAPLMLVLGAKTIVLLFLAFVLIRHQIVDAFAFAVGTASMVLGLVIACGHAMRNQLSMNTASIREG